MPTVLITGCDYGIGFEFARQYAADNWQVHATCLNTDSKSTVLALGERVSFHHPRRHRQLSAAIARRSLGRHACRFYSSTTRQRLPRTDPAR